ncbi:Zinc finger protein CONSTANS-LIKE 4 [Glycine soja]
MAQPIQSMRVMRVTLGPYSKVHAANKLALRHPRVAFCEVCEQASAHVTCKADAAALCLACDHDIHSANPLASCHKRIPVTSFFESVHSVKASSPINFHHPFFFDVDADVSTEEAKAASWLLANPKTYLNSSQYLFSKTESVPYVDLDYAAMDSKTEQKSSATADGVIPV